MTELPHWTALDASQPPGVAVLGGGGHVVGIVATDGARSEGWAARLAVEAAHAWSDAGIRLILADGSLTHPLLHAELALENGEGVSDALVFGASVRRVARRVEGRGFFAVTAGTVVADAAEAMSCGRWKHLCAGFRDAGVTLAVYLDGGDPSSALALAEASHVLVLAGPGEDVPEVVMRSGAQVVGLVGPEAGAGEGQERASSSPSSGDAGPGDGHPEDASAEDTVEDLHPDIAGAADAAESGTAADLSAEASAGAAVPVEPEEDTGVEGSAATPADAAAREGSEEDTEVASDVKAAAAPAPARAGGQARRTGSGRGLIALLLIIVAAVLAAAWFGFIEIPGLTPSTGSGQATSRAQGPPVAASVATAPAAEASPVQGFSVVLSTSADAAEARALADSMGGALPDVLFTVVPIEVNGRSLYRTLAGPAVDSSAAAALVLRLADAWARGAEGELQPRATPRAFELGEMADPDAARRRVDVLRGLEVPAYVLAVDYADGSTRYRVYAGAFADEEEAALLHLHLTDRGLKAAHLSDRKGRLPA